MPRVSKQDVPADLHDAADRINAAEEFKELAQTVGYAPVVPTIPVRVHLGRPLAGSSKVPGELDRMTGVISVKVGKESAEFSIHSPIVLYWVPNPVTK